MVRNKTALSQRIRILPFVPSELRIDDKAKACRLRCLRREEWLRKIRHGFLAMCKKNFDNSEPLLRYLSFLPETGLEIEPSLQSPGTPFAILRVAVHSQRRQLVSVTVLASYPLHIGIQTRPVSRTDTGGRAWKGRRDK